MEHYNGRPINDVKRSEMEIRTYDFLDKMGVFYETICHEAVYTMGDCETVEKELGAPICKNLFLCNRQQTQFYLLMSPNDKHFKTKSLSSELECPRLSFADEQHMIGLLGIHPGAVSPMGLINDKEKKVLLRLCKLNCVMLYSHSISSVGERPAPRGGTTRPDERKITII